MSDSSTPASAGFNHVLDSNSLQNKFIYYNYWDYTLYKTHDLLISSLRPEQRRPRGPYQNCRRRLIDWRVSGRLATLPPPPQSKHVWPSGSGRPLHEQIPIFGQQTGRGCLHCSVDTPQDKHISCVLDILSVICNIFNILKIKCSCGANNLRIKCHNLMVRHVFSVVPSISHVNSCIFDGVNKKHGVCTFHIDYRICLTSVLHWYRYELIRSFHNN